MTSIGLPVAIVIALIPLRDDIENTNLALGLVVVVVSIAVVGGRIGGILAALSSALSFDVFLTRPYYSFRMRDLDDLLTTILLAVIGVIAGELVERCRAQRCPCRGE